MTALAMWLALGNLAWLALVVVAYHHGRREAKREVKAEVDRRIAAYGAGDREAALHAAARYPVANGAAR